MANTKKTFFSSNFNGKTGNTFPHSFLFRMQMNIMKIVGYDLQSNQNLPKKNLALGPKLLAVSFLIRILKVHNCFMVNIFMKFQGNGLSLNILAGSFLLSEAFIQALLKANISFGGCHDDRSATLE